VPKRTAAGPPVRFGVLGLAHVHVFGMAGLLRAAGCELVAFHGDDPAQAEGFGRLHPGARLVRDRREILEDPSVPLLLCADVPDRRAATCMEAMRHGKDLFVDKPAAVTRGELAALRRVREETGRVCAIFYSERLASRSTCRALELVRAGAVGDVVETVGLGPHQLGLTPRPDWFFDPARSGGILGDLASHQMDQFLIFTGAREARVVAAQTANRAHPEHRGFEDYGSVLVRGDHATGYVRVDWYTPAGLGTWGDVRLFVLGTAGHLEVRKNADPAGRPGPEHVILVDGDETRHVDCTRDPLRFPGAFLADLAERTDHALPHDHAFHAQDLALTAQAMAASRADEGDGSIP
jgi:predicted dehydrogenase